MLEVGVAVGVATEDCWEEEEGAGTDEEGVAGIETAVVIGT